MAENGEKKARGRGRPIQKGQVLNPGGRPKIPEDIKEAARAASAQAIKVLVDIMSNEEANQGERIKAAIAILNRAWGTPAQSVEITGRDGGALSVQIEYVSKKE